MSNGQNQGTGQPTPPPVSPAPAPAPQPDIVDIYTDPAIIGTDNRHETTPAETGVVRPQGNIETR